MKNWRIYKVYLDDGNDVYKVLVPAPTEDAAKSYCKGNGEIIAIKEEEVVNGIYTETLAENLSKIGYGQAEIDIITRLIIMVGLDK